MATDYGIFACLAEDLIWDWWSLWLWSESWIS